MADQLLSPEAKAVTSSTQDALAMRPSYGRSDPEEAVGSRALSYMHEAYSGCGSASDVFFDVELCTMPTPPPDVVIRRSLGIVSGTAMAHQSWGDASYGFCTANITMLTNTSKSVEIARQEAMAQMAKQAKAKGGNYVINASFESHWVPPRYMTDDSELQGPVLYMVTCTGTACLATFIRSEGE